jgi:hypothetical protein
MTVMAKDDGWVRSHEEAATLMRYSALGATVIIDPLVTAQSKRPDMLSATRQFTLVLDAAPYLAVNARDFYTLPCKANRLGARVRELCNIAQASLAPLVLTSAPTVSE